MALIRYPGSKEKLRREIVSRFPDEMMGELWSGRRRWEYREPFFGAGAIGFGCLNRLDIKCGVWLNDIDPGMAALWSSVRDHPEELISHVMSFKPTVDAFVEFKGRDGSPGIDRIVAGFMKLALHRMSFSGLGVMAGGPIGGMDQSHKVFDVGCRWKPVPLCGDIKTLSRILRRFHEFSFTCGDFGELIVGAPRECFIYVDPPYYEKGPQLYKYSMLDSDHIRLRDMLMECQAQWVLSYDDHPAIRDLYSGWTTIEPVSITYTTATSKTKRPKNQEVVITKSAA